MDQQSKTHSEDNEISLLELATALGEEKKLLFGLPFIAAIASIVVSLLMTPIFTAETTILPPTSSSSGASALLGNIEGLAGLAGLPLGGGSQSSTLYISMLESRSAKDMLIDKFDLLNHYNAEMRQDVYWVLNGTVEIEADKISNLIAVRVHDKDPEFAARLANGYYDTLVSLLDRVAVTDAQKKRAFFQDQFAQAKEYLADAEVKLTKVQETTGVLELQSQAEATLEALAVLRSQVVQREAMLSALRTYTTSSNPQYRKLVGELGSLRSQLKSMEEGSSADMDNNDLGRLNVGNLPRQGLEYVRALRDVKYQTALYEIMAKQLEMAKLEEAKEGAGVQQLDQAKVPERRTSPKRGKIVVLSTLAAGFLAVLLALLRAALRKNNDSSVQRQRISGLKRAWFGR